MLQVPFDNNVFNRSLAIDACPVTLFDELSLSLSYIFVLSFPTGISIQMFRPTLSSTSKVGCIYRMSSLLISPKDASAKDLIEPVRLLPVGRIYRVATAWRSGLHCFCCGRKIDLEFVFVKIPNHRLGLLRTPPNPRRPKPQPMDHVFRTVLSVGIIR